MSPSALALSTRSRYLVVLPRDLGSREAKVGWERAWAGETASSGEGVGAGVGEAEAEAEEGEEDEAEEVEEEEEAMARRR